MALDTDKLNYSIGQVAEIAGVAQSTLRYWETVIHRLEPQKTAGGSRRYNKDTIELILVVRDLLHEQGLTIKGANLYKNVFAIKILNSCLNNNLAASAIGCNIPKGPTIKGPCLR